MDYEKKYKEALSKCKAYIDDTEKRWSEEFSRATEEVFKEIFPELRESEDERIRKELVEKISNLACGCFISQEQKQKFITYLEKQKEQKPAEWSEEDEKMRDRIIDILNRTFSVSALGASSTRPSSCLTYEDEIAWLKSLRPSWKPND